METNEPAALDASKKKRRVWAIALVMAIVVMAAIGAAAYLAGLGVFCGPVCGLSGNDVPVILNASVNQSTAYSVRGCGIVTQGYPQAAVCEVTLTPGTSGTIVLSMASQNGDSQVAFGTYSSSQYVQFKQSYPCMYSSGPPNYSLRCDVSGSGSTFRFDYSPSAGLTSETEAVLTIVVTKTCCWP